MATRSIVSPEDQSATFVELFFDLVFVFSVTQVVSLLHHDPGWAGVGQALLVFWLVWWAWTQFTWTLNAADTTHHVIDLVTLAATAVVFFMAVSLPEAFQGKALWFAVPYVLVRLIGLALQFRVAREDPLQHHGAALTWAALSLGGMAAVLVGALVGGSALYWVWGLAILLDLGAAAVSGRREGWNLHPEHFAERHGLFVILALGETLIAAGSVVSDASETGAVISVMVLAVAFSCGLWWTYFPQGLPALERAMISREGTERSAMARDAFSLLHFPLVCGVIAYAVAVEQAVAHPGEPLALEARMALALGLLLFLGGMAAAVRRATGRLLGKRLLVAGATAGVVVAADVLPVASLSIACAGVVAVAALERWGDGPLPDAAT